VVKRLVTEYYDSDGTLMSSGSRVIETGSVLKGKDAEFVMMFTRRAGLLAGLSKRALMLVFACVYEMDRDTNVFYRDVRLLDAFMRIDSGKTPGGSGNRGLNLSYKSYYKLYYKVFPELLEHDIVRETGYRSMYVLNPAVFAKKRLAELQSVYSAWHACAENIAEGKTFDGYDIDEFLDMRKQMLTPETVLAENLVGDVIVRGNTMYIGAETAFKAGLDMNCFACFSANTEDGNMYMGIHRGAGGATGCDVMEDDEGSEGAVWIGLPYVVANKISTGIYTLGTGIEEDGVMWHALRVKTGAVGEGLDIDKEAQKELRRRILDKRMGMD
jgi:hypothetical protein